MDIWDSNKFVLFISFVVPGFIAIKAYELINPSRYTDSSKQIVDSVSYSCLNYAVLFWPIYLIEQSKLKSSYPHLYILFYFFVMFIFPLILVFGWNYLRKREFIQKFVPHPTQKPWDFVFGKRRSYWVTVTLKNGEKIAGMYGSNSFVSSAPAKEQIYLEEYWLLNEAGGFDHSVDRTAGILILSSEIVSVELMHIKEEQDE